MTLLHHRRDLDDIRLAYGSDYGSDRSCQRESGSDRSYSTAPTQYSSSSNKRPPRIHYNTCIRNEVEATPRYFADQPQCESPRSSTGTYASTVESEQDAAADLPEFEVPIFNSQPYAPTCVEATPSDFSQLFPSHRRLAIRHDDSTVDGNMNLRIDTEVKMHGGRRCDMTLFHLRMHDLRAREFSFRRYCRDSGREVCHTTRRFKQPREHKRPGFQRSLSNALSSMRPRSRDQGTPTLATLTRNDSGYGSASASVRSSTETDHESRQISANAVLQQQEPEQNTIKLEYSNYAQVAIKRVSGAGKRYEFEYWGIRYTWKRLVERNYHGPAVSFHLVNSGSDRVLAYIEPSPLSPVEVEQERLKGGWIPPCAMWIADKTIVLGQKDVADVIISSGLIALVDNCIRERFHSRGSKQLLLPKLQLGVEYIGPKRLINEMFKRTASSTHSRQSWDSRPASNGLGVPVSRPAVANRHTSET